MEQDSHTGTKVRKKVNFLDFWPLLLITIFLGCLDFAIDNKLVLFGWTVSLGPNLNTVPHKWFLFSNIVYASHWIDVFFGEREPLARAVIYGASAITFALML